MNRNGFSASYGGIEDLEQKLVPDNKKDDHSLRFKIVDYFAHCTEIQPVHYKNIAEIIEEKDVGKVKKELDIQTNAGYLYNKGKKYGKKPQHKIIV